MGYITDQNAESTYSGVFALRDISLVMFLAELNALELRGADVGNIYPEANTKAKVCIVGGPECCVIEEHTLVIGKALCI
jgi:hypothetical protein